MALKEQLRSNGSMLSQFRSMTSFLPISTMVPPSAVIIQDSSSKSPVRELMMTSMLLAVGGLHDLGAERPVSGREHAALRDAEFLGKEAALVRTSNSHVYLILVVSKPWSIARDCLAG